MFPFGHDGIKNNIVGRSENNFVSDEQSSEEAYILPVPKDPKLLHEEVTKISPLLLQFATQIACLC